MFFRGWRPAQDVAGELWETELACQTANEACWATGREPAFSLAGHRAASLDSRLGRLTRRLERRAGALAKVPLDDLVDLAATDAVAAAAALRVAFSDVVLEDCESLQSGVELRAVGVYAKRS